MKKRETYEHPSYAMLELTKVRRGGETALFGSSIKHSDTIVLRIKKGKMDRNLNRDWYYDGKQYIEVEMSYNQFAEAITSFNYGGGVPVTLRRFNGENIEDCPYIDKRMQFENELNANLKGATAAIDKAINDVKSLFESKKTFSNKDKEMVTDLLGQISRSYQDSLPFMYGQFNEQMDKTVTEAKSEFESFVQSKLNNIALIALQEKRDEILALESPVEI